MACLLTIPFWSGVALIVSSVDENEWLRGRRGRLNTRRPWSTSSGVRAALCAAELWQSWARAVPAPSAFV